MRPQGLRPRELPSLAPSCYATVLGVYTVRNNVWFWIQLYFHHPFAELDFTV